jgi:hypothetical protein
MFLNYFHDNQYDICSYLCVPQDSLLLASRGAEDRGVGPTVQPDVCAMVHVAHPFLPLPEATPFLPESTELCGQNSIL